MRAGADPGISKREAGPFSSPSLLSFPSPLPLQVGPPLVQLGGLGSTVSSPSGVRGRAPAENEFGAL